MKYNKANGPIKGHTGASVVTHENTYPMSTYMRYGISGPGPLKEGEAMTKFKKKNIAIWMRILPNCVQ